MQFPFAPLFQTNSPSYCTMLFPPLNLSCPPILGPSALLQDLWFRAPSFQLVFAGGGAEGNKVSPHSNDSRCSTGTNPEDLLANDLK